MTDLAGTGRHLTPEQLRVWTSFLDAGRIIESELAAHLSRDHAMSHREYEVLVRVDGAGGAMRLVHLARQIEASRALISQTIDRLVERGWIERRRIDGDRRGVEAALTEAGTDALRAASGPHADLVCKLLIEPIGADLPAVARSLGEVADHLRSHRAGSGCARSGCPLHTDHSEGAVAG